MKQVRVELYGLLRARAGCEVLTLSASSVAEALAAAEARCPALAGLLVDGRGRPRPDYRVALRGGAIVDDPDTLLSEGDALVLLSAHAGG
jgi:molybdopterin converting factor small subunit